MEELQTRLAWTPFELEGSGLKLNLSGSVGLVDYCYNGTGREELLAQASRALEQTGATRDGAANSISENEGQG